MQSPHNSSAVPILIVFALTLAGCATPSNGDPWGSHATFRPGWNRVLEAAQSAASEPRVWVPLAAAAILQVDNLDRRTSDWAREHTPVFGSKANAENWSNDLRSTAVVLGFGTMLATPSGDESGEWFENKAKGALVEVAAIGATSLSTTVVKKAAGRERPNKLDDESLPSGHASSAAANARLASINLEAMDLDPRLKRAADFGLDAITYGTAWARIESGWHYPSDTLVGIALGNYFATFFNRAFLDEPSQGSFAVSAMEGGAMLTWQRRL